MTFPANLKIHIWNQAKCFSNVDHIEDKDKKPRSLKIVQLSLSTTIEAYKIPHVHSHDSWLYIFDNKTTQSKIFVKNYFQTFSNLAINSHVYAALLDDQSITLFDVYKKAPKMDVTFEEVQIYLKLYQWY